MPKRDRSLYMREFMKEKRDTEKGIKYLLEECNIVGRENCEHVDSGVQVISGVSEGVLSDEVYEDVQSNTSMLSITSSENEVGLNKAESSYGDVEDIAAANSLFSSIDTQTLTKDFLYEWSLKYCIKDDALNALLKHFNKFTPSIPKCRQTLQKSLPKIDVLYVSGGDYKYLGVKSAIDYYMLTSGNKEKLDIIVSIDGAPIYNSKKTSIWPIVITINRKGPYAVAIWYGQGKPSNLDDYFKDFVLEMKELQTNGYEKLQVNIKAIVCDAPARAFVKCIIGHSGYHSCERCVAVGTQMQGVRILETNASLRTDVAFKNNLYKEEGHQLKSLSPLVQLNIPMVTGFPLDYMHLICLGVVKKLLFNWCKGPRFIRISQSVKDCISNELMNLRSYTPSNFQRRPRSLNELEKWKATEFRFFLLYAGPVVLKGKINKTNYDLFISLSIAMHILLSDKMVKNELLVAYAKQLLIWFVREVQILYGETFVTYNVHSMIHLADDCINFGESLDHLSAFPFENFLGRIKRIVQKSHQTVAQIVKQLDERKKFDIFLKERNDKKIPVRVVNNKITSNLRDRVYFIQDKGFILVEEVLVDLVKCKALNPHSVRNFFPDYFETSNLDVGYVNALANLKTIFLKKNQLLTKGLMIPVQKGGYAFFRLRHGDIAYDD